MRGSYYTQTKCDNYNDLMALSKVTQIQFCAGYISKSKHQIIMDYVAALYREKHSDLMEVRLGREPKDKSFFAGVRPYRQ